MKISKMRIYQSLYLSEYSPSENLRLKEFAVQVLTAFMKQFSMLSYLLHSRTNPKREHFSEDKLFKMITSTLVAIASRLSSFWYYPKTVPCSLL